MRQIVASFAFCLAACASSSTDEAPSSQPPSSAAGAAGAAGQAGATQAAAGQAAAGGDPGQGGSTQAATGGSSAEGGSAGGVAAGGAGGGAGGAAGSDAGEGGSAGAVGGAGGGGGEAPVATLAPWQPASKLKVKRDHHVTFAASSPAGTFLYVGSGFTGASMAAVYERARVHDDGSLGIFEKVTIPPRHVLGAGLAQIGRRFWLMGGLDDASTSVATVTAGEVLDDGKLSFAEAPPMAHDRYHVAVTAHGDHVYAMGGLVQTVDGATPMQTISDAIEMATFDGASLGPWQELAPLPYPLTHAATFTHDGHLFVVGGLTTTTARTEIQRAEIMSDGQLGAFEQAGELSEKRVTSAATVFEGHVYVVAGATEAQGGEVSTVLRARLNDDHTVGQFVELAPLPQARAHAHHAPIVGRVIYSAGGSVHHEAQVEVFSARLE